MTTVRPVTVAPRDDVATAIRPSREGRSDLFAGLLQVAGRGRSDDLGRAAGPAASSAPTRRPLEHPDADHRAGRDTGCVVRPRRAAEPEAPAGRRPDAPAPTDARPGTDQVDAGVDRADAPTPQAVTEPAPDLETEPVTGPATDPADGPTSPDTTTGADTSAPAPAPAVVVVAALDTGMAAARVALPPDAWVSAPVAPVDTPPGTTTGPATAADALAGGFRLVGPTVTLNRPADAAGAGTGSPGVQLRGHGAPDGAGTPVDVPGPVPTPGTPPSVVPAGEVTAATASTPAASGDTTSTAPSTSGAGPLGDAAAIGPQRAADDVPATRATPADTGAAAVATPGDPASEAAPTDAAATTTAGPAAAEGQAPGDTGTRDGAATGDRPAGEGGDAHGNPAGRDGGHDGGQAGPRPDQHDRGETRHDRGAEPVSATAGPAAAAGAGSGSGTTSASTPSTAAPSTAPTTPATPTAPVAGPVAGPVGSPGAAHHGASPAAATGVTGQVLPEVARLVSRGDGTQRVTVKLAPEALGEVRIVLTVRRGEVHVRMTGSEAAQAALLQGQSDLHRLLAGVGASASSVQVGEQSATFSTGPDGGHADGRSGGERELGTGSSGQPGSDVRRDGSGDPDGRAGGRTRSEDAASTPTDAALRGAVTPHDPSRRQPSRLDVSV